RLALPGRKLGKCSGEIHPGRVWLPDRGLDEVAVPKPQDPLAPPAADREVPRDAMYPCQRIVILADRRPARVRAEIRLLHEILRVRVVTNKRVQLCRQRRKRRGVELREVGFAAHSWHSRDGWPRGVVNEENHCMARFG